MKRQMHLVALLAALASGGAWADASPLPMDETAYEAAKARIEAQRDADRKLCKKLQGHDRDVCDAQAKGKAASALARLEAGYKPSPDATLEAKNATAEANYDVARVQCKAKKGEARDRCVSEAKAAREAAIRQAKVEKVQETGGPFARDTAERKGQGS